MAETNTQIPNKAAETSSPRASFPRSSSDRRQDGQGDRRGRGRRERAPREREKREFNQKIIDIRRVTRVMGGGRRFSFSVAMVLGDGKGRVGVGIGKAGDTALAIEKASRNAERNMLKVNRTDSFSIPHDVFAKYCASQVLIKPSRGRGVVAGSSVRDVLELAGVKDVSAKLLSRSKNKFNNAKAAIKALEKLDGVSIKPRAKKSKEVASK